MFEITKDFSFCYGHRVWNQSLNKKFADDLVCACRHLHGHEAKVEVTLTSDKLVKGMVTDFRHLEWLKRFLDAILDHKFILDVNDPMLPMMTNNHPTAPVYLHPNSEEGEGYVVAKSLDLSCLGSAENLDQEQIDYYESFVLVDFVPTSENMSKWLCDLITIKMQPLDVKVKSVVWWETPKSRAVYTNANL